MSDFSGAIVPENSPQGLINMLEEKGLKVEKYKNPEERTKLRDKFKDSMFDLGALLGTGSLGYQLLDDDKDTNNPKKYKKGGEVSKGTATIIELMKR